MRAEICIAGGMQVRDGDRGEYDCLVEQVTVVTRGTVRARMLIAWFNWAERSPGCRKDSKHSAGQCLKLCVRWPITSDQEKE
jgi:hypothetical protein